VLNAIVSGRLRQENSRNSAMPDQPILFGYPASTYTRMALVAADEKGIDYSFQFVASWDGYDKDPEFVGLHPFFKVPVLRHRDIKITETLAILMYFETAFDGPSLVPKDPVELAKMWEIISTTISYAWPMWVPVLATNRLFNPMAGDETDEGLIEARLPDICRAAEVVGTYLDVRRDRFDLADIVVSGALKYATETPEWQEIMRASPKLAAWWERIRVRSSIAMHMPDTDWAKRAGEMATRRA
jgi:glutathione S-transferase